MTRHSALLLCPAAAKPNNSFGSRALPVTAPNASRCDPLAVAQDSIQLVNDTLADRHAAVHPRCKFHVVSGHDGGQSRSSHQIG
jgi:hypothetical protein